MLVVAVLVVVAVVAGIVVSRGSRAAAEVERQHRVEPVRQQTRAALGRAASDVDPRQAATTTALTALFGAPTYTARTITCHLTGQGSLRVTSYHQECSLRTVELYPVDSGIVQVAAALERSPAPASAIGTQVPAVPPDGECGQFRYDDPAGGVESLRIGFLATRRLGLPGERPSPSDRCQPPDPVERWGDYAFVSAPTFDPAAVPLTRNWLVVERTHDFLDLDLGCGRGLLCGQPLPGPVLP